MNFDNRLSHYLNISNTTYPTLLYYNDNTTVFYRRINRDKISKEKTVITNSSLAHNFYVYYDKRTQQYLGIGGQYNWKCDKRWWKNFTPEEFLKVYQDIKGEPYTRDLNRLMVSIAKIRMKIERLDHVRGLYLYTSKDGVHWDFSDDKHPIATRWHPGFIGMTGKSSEFDGISSILFNENDNLYYLYVRANVGKQRRFIQYTTSPDLKQWSDFKLINISGYNIELDNYYGPNFFAIEGLSGFYGILPYYNNKKSMVRFVRSTDAVNWTVFHNEHDSKIFSKPPKPYFYPVSGYVRDGDKFTYYLLENYFGIMGRKPVSLKKYVKHINFFK